MGSKRAIRLPAAAVAGLLSVAFSADGWAQVEEIIVSTRKREENLQEVPIAVTAFSAETVERLALNDVRDLSKFTPSLIFDTGVSPQDTRITIRGLAPVRGRQNVAVLQDGVDITSQAIGTAGGGLLVNPRLFDIERVEVVKGPQNALYGRSAFNGAINYIMRRPTDELTVRAFTDVGSNGQAEIRGGVSGPLIGDTLLGDISAAAWTFDGFYKSPVTNADIGSEQGTAYAGSLLWNVTDRLSVRLRGEILDDEFGPPAYRQVFGTTTLGVPQAAVTAPGPGLLPVLSPGIVNTGVQNVFTGTLPDGGSLTPGATPDPRTGVDYPGTEREISRLTLTADYDFGPVKLTYLGHLANAETDQFLDGLSLGNVATEVTGSESRRNDDTDLQSHELRLTSMGDNRVDWVVGGLLWQEEVEQIDGTFTCVNTTGPTPPPPFPPCAPIMAAVGTTQLSQLNPDTWTRDTDHWSAYGLVDIQVLDSVNVILEGRYTSEDADYTGPERIRTQGGITQDRSRIVATPPSFVGYLPFLLPNFSTITATDDDSFFLPKATLQWRPADTAMVYFSWAEAAKPSGIAQVPGGIGGFENIETRRFEREEMTVWELGAKTDWFDRRLLANGAVFFQDYTDKQVAVQQVNPDTGLLEARTANAAGAEVWGFEAELQWFATDYLQLRAGYTFLDTEYTDYQERTAGAANVALASLGRPDNCTVAVADVSNQATCILDLSGNELEYAPRNALVAGFTLQGGLPGDRQVFVEGDLVYQDERYLDRFNTASLDAFTTFDLRFGIRAPQWDVTVYAENLFADDTVKNSLGIINLRDIAVYAPFNGNPPPTTTVLPPSQLAILPDLRQFGIRASFRFGGGA
jgi:outer membrane receptor protein involved in Fe transport